MKKNITEALFWAGASLLVVLGAIFGLMQDNLGSVHLRDVARPVAVLLPVFVLATALLMAIHRPLARIFPVAIFLYFYFYEINKFVFGFKDVVPIQLLTIFVLALYPCCLLALYVVLRHVDGLKASLYTFVITGSMASVTILVIAPSLFYDPPPKIDAYFEKATLAAVKAHKGGASDLPDIIYVIPDRYASRATLLDEFGFDNTAFYAELRKRGFFVAENSWANYPRTFQSMASTLNSGYLQDFTKTYGADSSDQRPVHEKLEANIVQDRLRRLGYRFHNYGNWWEPTRINRWASVNYQGYLPNSLLNLSEFERALLRKTPTMKIVRLFTDAEDKRECRRIKRKLRRIREVGNQPQPVFVLAHLMVPHDPIVMNAAGQCLDKPIFYHNKHTSTLNKSRIKTAHWDAFKAGYIEYLKYFNSAILRTIDEQLKRRGETGRKLLFIIQSDEGPYPKSMRDAMNQYHHSRFSRQEVRMKFGIINALLLPKALRRGRPKLTTPVNNWRVIFNALTGSKIELLPDKVFSYPSEKKIFDFCEITDIVTNPEAAPTCKNR